MADQEDLVELAIKIVKDRALPYNLIVEKVEGDLIQARNNWGSRIVYKQLDEDHFELQPPTED